jgi:hypothetical protein
MNNTSEPMIPVKMPDGTIVRKPLSSLNPKNTPPTPATSYANLSTDGGGVQGDDDLFHIDDTVDEDEDMFHLDDIVHDSGATVITPPSPDTMKTSTMRMTEEPTISSLLSKTSSARPNQTPTSPNTSSSPMSPKLTAFPAPKVSHKSPIVEVKGSSPQAYQVYGPIDELGAFTLADFRRLADDPVQAVEKLTMKLANLQKDSYLLYIRGVEAWLKSPLYREYQQVLLASLSSGRPVSEVVAGDDISLRPEEFRALAEFDVRM